MRILFTPVGTTDPVRGFHDGPVMQILRHYPVDKVIVFLTQEMADNEAKTHCYSLGIHAIVPDCPIKFIKSGITNPQDYEALAQIQNAFDKAYHDKAYAGAEWLLNITSGTPQIMTVMTLLAMDYPRTRGIQVATPERRANNRNHPEETAEGLAEMLELNEDNDPKAPNRCTEPPLGLLKKHRITNQIESLVNNYEYGGALQLAQQNKTLLSDTTVKLLQHAVDRSNLQWRKANQVIALYKGKKLLQVPGVFPEYFQVMELRQRKKELPDFIIKLSPLLMPLGEKYVNTLPGFSLSDCGYSSKKGFRLTRRNIGEHYPELLSWLDQKKDKPFSDTPLYFWFIVDVCDYYLIERQYHRQHHQEITAAFGTLRDIEEKERNEVAHSITDLTEEKLKKETGYASADILKLLRHVIELIQGRQIPWTYGYLNTCILDSLHDN